MKLYHNLFYRGFQNYGINIQLHHFLNLRLLLNKTKKKVQCIDKKLFEITKQIMKSKTNKLCIRFCKNKCTVCLFMIVYLQIGKT